MSAFNTDENISERFIFFKEKYGIKTAIETGTYHGATTVWLAENFDTVYTVEYDARYLEVAKEKISKYDNINSYLGNSIEYLKKFLTECKDTNPMVFLDAHWYANPVLQELDMIKESGVKPVLAIHDFRVPGRPDLGYDLYPEQDIVYEWEWIRERIESIYGIDKFEIEYNTYSKPNMRGCIFIMPK
jgi:predicted O-methyltransferase YrrM